MRGEPINDKIKAYEEHINSRRASLENNSCVFNHTAKFAPTTKSKGELKM
jgi:hypothetical protein